MTQRKTLEQLLQQHQQQAAPAPNKDLWQGIEHALVRQPQGKANASSVTKPWFAIAASILMVAVLVSQWWPKNTTQQPQTIYELAQQLNQAQDQQVELIKARFEAAGYKAPSGNFAESLANLQQARKQVTESLMKSPNDRSLLEMLRWVNQQELKLLDQAYAKQSRLQQL